ncbi:MAG TPA: DUF6077 domain-containing protein [Lachnospiraceae bacterium]|nr:DUF6077 domain-containing protein [Lachnospiraceae bacterium]
MAQMILLVVIITLLPFTCGLLPVRGMVEEHRTLVMVYVAGWFMMFSMFQVVIIPFIILKKPFSLATTCVSYVMIVFAIISLIVGRKVVSECFIKVRRSNNQKNGWKLFGWLLVILLIVTQMIFFANFQHLDGDDAYFIAIANDCISFDSMYLRNAYTGDLIAGLDIRHALSPVPVFMAWIGKSTGVSPTVIAHSVLAPIFLGLMYLVYAVLGRRLLKDKKQYVPLFVIFTMVWYIFGNVSIYTTETFAYMRTWQGKAMFGNLVIPMIYVCILFYLEEKRNWGEWLLLFAVVVTAIFTTSTAVFMIPIILLLTIIFSFTRIKKFGNIFGLIICLVPCFFYGLLYLIFL